MRVPFASLLAVAVLLPATAAYAAETIRANAVKEDPRPTTSFFTVDLDRYSTDEERAKWREAFSHGGQEALVGKWQDDNPTVGHCAFTNTVGYRIRAAISVPTEGGGRKIIMLTDRPIAGFEVMANTRSADYPIGWIEVTVDKDGKGEGRLVAAAAFELNDENRLVMTTFGTRPVKLLNVVVESR